jgi:hypothetical protein
MLREAKAMAVKDKHGDPRPETVKLDLTDVCACPRGMRYHANNCPWRPGEAKAPRPSPLAAV